MGRPVSVRRRYLADELGESIDLLLISTGNLKNDLHDEFGRRPSSSVP